jgi:hypothetical protein
MSDWLRRDPETGFVIGPDGCQYANEHQAAHHALLHLCGCGLPEKAFNLCRDVLCAFDRRGCHDWIDAEAAVEALIKERADETAHVLAHLLNHLGLIEHGGTVGGSWLTDDGKRIVDLGPATEELMDEGD